MQRGWQILAFVALSTVVLAGAKPFFPKAADRWLKPGYERKKLEKIVVIGITDDQEVRRRFEDKVVTFLSFRDVEAVTSYSFVPDLTEPGDGQVVADRVLAAGVDAAITIRLVALEKQKEETWAVAWREAVDDDVDLRTMIRESLPPPAGKRGKLGVDVGLWDSAEWDRVWGIRSEGYSLKQLRNNTGSFVKGIMDALKEDRLI